MINKKLLQERIAEAKNLMETTNKAGVLVILQAPVPGEHLVLFPQVRESISNILLFIEIGNPDVIPELSEHICGIFDALVIDGLSDAARKLTPEQTLERFCYIGTKENIKTRYMNGEEI